jgi:hypothetical protein
MLAGIALQLLRLCPQAAAFAFPFCFAIYPHFLRHSRQPIHLPAVGYLFHLFFSPLKMFYYEQKIA